MPSRPVEKEYQGIPVSSGVAIGKVFLFDSEEEVVTRYKIQKADIPTEIARFEEALIATRREILDIQKKISKSLGVEHGEIFNAHLLVLEDRVLIEEVIKKLGQEKVNVEHIFSTVARKYAQVFSKMEDEYLKERSSDIRDVSHRVLHNLIGKKRQDLADLEEEVIVVAYDLAPSDTALMHKEKVIGFVTDIGGRTSHTAIMARALGIPAVVGLHDVSKRVPPHATIIIDGHKGVLIVNPSKATLKRYAEEQTKLEIFEEKLAGLRNLPAETKDGHRVELSANIEMPEEVDSVLAHGADGIGLYRTEFLFMNRHDLPTEEEQYNAYRMVAERVAPQSVIIRTLDLGGDKFLSHLQVAKEMNPFLGWRAIRFCLARPDVFKAQLRAILKASGRQNVKIMYPMISGVEEVVQANAILKEAMEEVRKQGIPFDENIPVGAMIEIPSAALTADLLAKEVDFFSVGTNDLIQYSLAIDRVNEKVAYLYEPMHPGIIRLIKSTVDAGHANGIWVGMCGEMAGDLASVLILLGLGLDEFSISAVMIPEIKKVIRSVKMEECRELAREILLMQDPTQIRLRAMALLKNVTPELVDSK